VLAVCAGLPRALTAQQPSLPSPSQSQSALQQAIQQNPGLADVLRQRLGQSGMTPEQIRARLQASGYPPSLLDAYLGGAAAPGQQQAAPGAQELAAIQALGLSPIQVQVESLPVDTGLVAAGHAAAVSHSAVFGVDVFRRTTTQFLPTLTGPVPADYRLGPGDNLVLIITGEIEFAYSLPVTREGFIFIPQVGQVFVSNLTLDQLRDVLYSRLGRVYSGVKPGPNPTTRFDISVANVRANQVYVVGEVTQPGAYQISSLGTVLTALYAAGGVTELANMRGLEVRRGKQLVATFDLYDYLLRGDIRSDVRLETGDVIFVPIHGTRVGISGAIRRPAIYELKSGEMLADLIQAAAGFRPDAQLTRIAVYRLIAPADRGPGAPPRAVIDLALVKQATGVAIPDLALQDGDAVVVDEVRPLEGQYYVAIAGRVHQPGMYPWHAGMTLRDLVLLGRGPSLGAYLKEAEIARLPDDRSKGQLAQTIRVPLDSSYLADRDSAGPYFGPPGIPAPASGTPEVRLEPYDNVLILREPDFELQRTVRISGEVRFPGTYALATKAEHLADLITRAGGLTPEAYPEGVRFTRQVNAVGRIDVDLVEALKEPASGHNIVLQPGDSLHIPEYEPSVKVSGAVNSPGSVLWQKGSDLASYISAAGGYTFKADQGRVSVRYANGQVRTRHKTLFFSSSPAPGPGAEVLVPVKDTMPGTNLVVLFGAIAQVLASVLTIALVATKL
jgi:polysaccharide biosynthesis/export protein